MSALRELFREVRNEPWPHAPYRWYTGFGWLGLCGVVLLAVVTCFDLPSAQALPPNTEDRLRREEVDALKSIANELRQMRQDLANCRK